MQHKSGSSDPDRASFGGNVTLELALK